jgi:probable rRNA maturation factor
LIPVANRQRRVPVSAAQLRAVVAAAFARERAGEPDIAVSVVDDTTIRELNARWLGHDWATDSIAFSYAEDPAPDGVRGEVVVSAETAARQARARGFDPRGELLLYVAHGALHLLGWDDRTAAARAAMNARARAIVRSCAAARGGGPRARRVRRAAR